MKNKIGYWDMVYNSNKMIRFKHINTPHILEIYKEKIEGIYHYFVSVIGDENISDKEFETRTKAIKFAEKYMKEHGSSYPPPSYYKKTEK